MQILVLIAIGFLLCTLAVVYEHNTRQKKLMSWIKNIYGKKPEQQEHDWERIAYYWKEFSDGIAAEEKVDAVTWNDLDMNHVFSRINNCKSFVGEQILYHSLHHLPKDNISREELNNKVQYFAMHAEQREAMEFLMCNLGKETGSYYLPMFINNLKVFTIERIWIYRLLQALLVLSVFPAVILRDPSWLICTVAFFVANLTVFTINKSKYEVNLDTLNGVIRIIKAAKQIVYSGKLSYEGEFHDLKEEVLLFQSLSRMVGRLEKKRQASFSGDVFGLLYDYIIGATLTDFTKYDRIMKILKGRQQEFNSLYEKIGMIDMAISIASFRESLPFYSIPEFHKAKEIDMDEIYHPLIDQPVTNTVTLENNCIITGSNASGKSTFIKAVAINGILAQSINTCTAKRATLPYASVITSMAVRDDLMSGESYYIKEIKYLNRIIHSLDPKRMVLCVIDEILKGTNTEERIAASVAILKYLDDKNCIAIVASHDIELTRILKEYYTNYHFQEIIRKNDIVFEYKIHPGPAISKNAIRLLEYVQFPAEIIADAKANLNQ